MGRNELDRIYVSDVKLTKIYCGGVEVRTVFNPAKTLNVCPAMTVLAARSTLGVRFASGIGGSPVWTTLIGESNVVRGMGSQSEIMDATDGCDEGASLYRCRGSTYYPHSSPKGHQPWFLL